MLGTLARLVNNKPASQIDIPKMRFPESMPTNRPSAKRSAKNVVSGMGDLFGEPELPVGFRYILDVLSSAEEKSLVQRFEKLPLKPFEFHGYQGNRRIYTFGHRYIFAGQEPRADASIPDYLRPLTEIASRTSGVPADAFEQLMLTEYAPGAGIGWHRDRPTYEDIVAVSFLAPCTLRLRRKVGEEWERRSAHIEPRSVYLLHGPVRNSWQHSIAPMDVLRYSVTLRTFRPGHSSKDQQASDSRDKPRASRRDAAKRAIDRE
jgi:alkylated DNA repair dioxygenase AlkB